MSKQDELSYWRILGYTTAVIIIFQVVTIIFTVLQVLALENWYILTHLDILLDPEMIDNMFLLVEMCLGTSFNGLFVYLCFEKAKSSKSKREESEVIG